jgi:hypothetical protein
VQHIPVKNEGNRDGKGLFSVAGGVCIADPINSSRSHVVHRNGGSTFR